MLEEKQHYKDTARLVSDHLTLHSLLTLSVSQYPPIRDAQRISQVSEICIKATYSYTSMAPLSHITINSFYIPDHYILVLGRLSLVPLSQF